LRGEKRSAKRSDLFGSNFTFNERRYGNPPLKLPPDHRNLTKVYGILGASEEIAMTYLGKGITIAILDSGIESNHFQFTGRVLTEVCIAQAKKVGTQESPFCKNGKSIHVGLGAASTLNKSGVVMSNHGNRTASVFLEFAPSAKIIMIRSQSELKSLQWIDANKLKYKIAGIIWNSSELPYFNSGSKKTCLKSNLEKHQLVSKLIEQGLPIFTSTGNDSNARIDTLKYPNCDPLVISVSATNHNDVIAEYANYSSATTFVAPDSVETAYFSKLGAVNEWSSTLTQGTSWTTPIVAALFARGKQLDPSLNQKNFIRFGRETAKSILANGSTKLYRINFDKFLMKVKVSTESK
jgi:subtilisin family serine protease